MLIMNKHRPTPHLRVFLQIRELDALVCRPAILQNEYYFVTTQIVFLSNLQYRECKF